MNNSIKHYCPLCLQPMIVNEYDEDVYLCYNTHLNGQGAWINLNTDKKREIKFPDIQDNDN